MARATATGLIVADPLSVVMTSSLPWISTLCTSVDRLARASATPDGSPSTRATITSAPTDRFRSVGRALGDDLAVVDDADPVGELVGLLEVLRGEEDRHAELLVEPAHLVPHARPAHRVEPGGRLVEEQDVGVVHERGGEVEASLHAARVRADAPIEGVGEVDQLAELGDPLLHHRFGRP